MVTVTGVRGEMGIYPQHIPLMTRMLAGELVVRKGGRDLFVVVGGGLVQVTGTRVNILMDMAVAADQIDQATAEEARRRAEARRRDILSDEEVATIEASLARSLDHLRVKRRHRG